jgi:hypothetical protein
MQQPLNRCPFSLYGARFCTMDSALLGSAALGLLMLYDVRFSTEMYTRGCHWFPRIHLGRPLLLPVGAVNYVETLKDKLVPTAAAILISVTFILIFGEIVPQAICTGPRRLQVAAGTAVVLFDQRCVLALYFGGF